MKVKFSLKDKAFRTLANFFYDLHLLVNWPWQWQIDFCVWVSSLFRNRVPVVFLLLAKDNLGTLHDPVEKIFSAGKGGKLVERYPDLLKTWNEIGNHSPNVPGPDELVQEFLAD